MEFLTIEEVAKLFKVSKRTIQRWLKDNGLKAYKFGVGKTATLRIEKSEIEKFIKKHRR